MSDDSSSISLRNMRRTWSRPVTLPRSGLSCAAAQSTWWSRRPTLSRMSRSSSLPASRRSTTRSRSWRSSMRPSAVTVRSSRGPTISSWRRSISRDSASCCEHVAEIAELREKSEVLTRQMAGVVRFGDLLTCDPRLIQLFTRAKRLARYRAPVLITGERGTGKETLARALHASSTPNRPLIVVSGSTASVDEIDRGYADARGGTLLIVDTSTMSPPVADRVTSLLDRARDERRRRRGRPDRRGARGATRRAGARPADRRARATGRRCAARDSPAARAASRHPGARA